MLVRFASFVSTYSRLLSVITIEQGNNECRGVVSFNRELLKVRESDSVWIRNWLASYLYASIIAIIESLCVNAAARQLENSVSPPPDSIESAVLSIISPFRPQLLIMK